MKQEKKYDGYGGCLLIIVALIAVVVALAGCSKAEAQQPPSYNRYTMVVDWHSLDTTRLFHRYTQDLGVLVPSEAIKIDTAKDLWYINCQFMDTLNHLYYLRNGLKIN